MKKQLLRNYHTQLIIDLHCYLSLSIDNIIIAIAYLAIYHPRSSLSLDDTNNKLKIAPSWQALRHLTQLTREMCPGNITRQ